jgi:hypothetical protein
MIALHSGHLRLLLALIGIRPKPDHHWREIADIQRSNTFIWLIIHSECKAAQQPEVLQNQEKLILYIFSTIL